LRDRMRADDNRGGGRKKWDATHHVAARNRRIG